MQGQTQTLKKTSTSQKYDWRDRSLCRDLDTNLFFPNLSGTNNAENYISANLPCHKCPVTKECIQYANSNHEEWGVWGGVYRSPRIKKNG
jgi:WhiB family redox-sensing transcriptional regulator